MELFEGPQGDKVRNAVVAAAWLLVAFLAVQTVSGLTSLRYIGAGLTATNTINVSGHGEVLAVPDIATFSFSIVSDKATVAAAQADATAKINATTDYLTAAGVDKKDIQTSDYSVYPQYEYQNAVCPQPAPMMPVSAPSASEGSSGSVSSGSAIYCPPGKQVLKGYEVRQTTTVKVRDTAKAGDLLAGVGTKGATEVSGLTFTFDNPDAVQNDARTKAIADAKQKADTLAKQLGVTLVRVVSFNESGNNPYPIMYAKGMGMATADSAPAAPAISTGQNKITDDVSITYEIR